MSILLDAVTRNKQQEGLNVPDPVMTPRPNYEPRSENQLNLAQLKWPIAFTLALGVGVCLAWFASQFNQGRVVDEQSNKRLLVQAHAEEQTSKTTQVQQAQTDDSAASVRIAGKVALPMPKPYVAPVESVNARTSNKLASNASASNPLASTPMESSDANSPSLSQAHQSALKSSGEGEPIILGANANQRGMDELAKLKREVEYAAFDVGIEAQPKSTNNLVAAFEAALKDVEANESKNAEVTSDELNPIPQVATSDGVRKFGELPLSVQGQVPEFTINAHVYASAPERRWLNVDGVELQQGDSISGGLKIIEIRPRDVILEIQGESFKVPAI